MFLNLAVATLVLGSMFSISAQAAEESDDKKRRRANIAAPQTFEPVVDIHHSPAILSHPTPAVQDSENITQLKQLREAGIARESALRKVYESRGAAYPVRFEGD